MLSFSYKIESMCWKPKKINSTKSAKNYEKMDGGALLATDKTLIQLVDQLQALMEEESGRHLLKKLREKLLERNGWVDE